MDEATLEKHAGFTGLQANLALLLEALHGFVLRRA
jgi:hypothetical protein